MEYPAIEVKHGAFAKALDKVSRALEAEGVQSAILASIRQSDATPEVLSAAESRCLGLFGGLPSPGEASELARASFVIRASQLAAGYSLRPDEQVGRARRAIMRLVSATPALSDEGEFYALSMEALSGRMAGTPLHVGRASARWVVNYFMRQTGARAFAKHRAADASGFFFTAWVDTTRHGVKMLEALSASATQKAANRKLLDAREGKCLKNPAIKCVACQYGYDQCTLGRWRRTLVDGNCPSCGAARPMLPGGICIECVITGRYRK